MPCICCRSSGRSASGAVKHFNARAQSLRVSNAGLLNSETGTSHFVTRLWSGFLEELAEVTEPSLMLLVISGMSNSSGLANGQLLIQEASRSSSLKSGTESCVCGRLVGLTALLRPSFCFDCCWLFAVPIFSVNREGTLVYAIKCNFSHIRSTN